MTTGYVIGPPIRDWVAKKMFEYRRRKELKMELIAIRTFERMMGGEDFEEVLEEHYSSGCLTQVQYEAIVMALEAGNTTEAVRLFEKYHNER